MALLRFNKREINVLRRNHHDPNPASSSLIPHRLVGVALSALRSLRKATRADIQSEGVSETPAAAEAKVLCLFEGGVGRGECGAVIMWVVLFVNTINI